MLNHYKALLEKNGAFTLEDLVGLVSALTDAQIEGGLMEDREVSGAVMTATGDRHGRTMLRAYGLMDAIQRASLTSEAGLPFGRLTDAQWDYIYQIITDDLGGIQIMDGSIRIVPEPNRKIFEITVLSPDEQQPRTIRVSVAAPTRAYLKEMQEQRKK